MVEAVKLENHQLQKSEETESFWPPSLLLLSRRPPVSPSLVVSSLLQTAGFIVRTSLVPAGGSLDGLDEPVSKGEAKLTAVAGIVEAGLGLLEIDRTLGLLCIENIPKSQLYTRLTIPNLFGYGC